MKPRRRVLVLSGWLHPPMADGLARFAREAKWHLYSVNVFSGIAPRDIACDGMLMFHTDRADLIHMARQQAARCPAVLVSGMKPVVDAPVVAEDNVGIGRLAVQHFLERGFRQFAWLCNNDRKVAHDRRAGFLTALQEADMPCTCIEWHPSDAQQWRAASRRIAKQLRALPHPLALFAVDDAVAVDAVELCLDHDIRVPDDAAVLGVGNAALLCDFSQVPLSSIDVDWSEIVYRAAGLLDRLMSRRRPPKEPLIIPPSGVVVRASTDILAVPQPYLAAALRFVREHFREPITVHHVAAAVGVTRRTLEKHFRRHLKMGLAEEIRRRRLDCARDLLLNTDWMIAEIATEAGFESSIHLAKVFRRELGVQPRRYRQQHQRPSPPRPREVEKPGDEG